jgi:hypothetical protein
LPARDPFLHLCRRERIRGKQAPFAPPAAAQIFELSFNSSQVRFNALLPAADRSNFLDQTIVDGNIFGIRKSQVGDLITSPNLLREDLRQRIAGARLVLRGLARQRLLESKGANQLPEVIPAGARFGEILLAGSTHLKAKPLHLRLLFPN